MRLQMTGMVLDAPAACVLLAVWYMSAVTTEWIQGLPVLSLTIVFTMGAALFWERLAASSMKYEGMGPLTSMTVLPCYSTTLLRCLPNRLFRARF